MRTSRGISDSDTNCECRETLFGHLIIPQARDPLRQAFGPQTKTQLLQASAKHQQQIYSLRGGTKPASVNLP